ncbi:hypothetical protein M3148_10740 [Georgenia satyanarayanai]|uniref:hypothetical protein n=1 Tax=Georgenia satyanarayanai TaxID=860221 RepID=UPI00203F7ED7|nr:hypothetical protein [Georgenia satyanarayanai]MCM3661459.1 hypothetical protein [Georgenia satyanarayanai]
MGFSPLDAVVSVAVLLPSLLLLPSPPPDLPSPPLPTALSLAERASQTLCLTVPAVTVPGRVSWFWAVPVALVPAAYYGLWARYLTGGRASADLYRRLWGLPVPMAVTPVLAFLSVAAWLCNPWIAGAAVVLAAGHVPASAMTVRTLAAQP